jgi:hypothetical protein
VVSDVLAILNRHVADGPEAAALAVWRAAGAMAAAAAEAAAVIADDTAREPRLRVAGLLAAALLVQGGAPVPATALVALGDDVLVDAVLEAGASAAITGLAAAWAVDDRPFAETVAAGVPAALCAGAAAAARAVGAGHHHPLVTALESRAATA